MDFFNVNTVMLSIFGYDLSYIEFFGTIFYFLSAILIALKRIETWPASIISVILYGIIFFQIQLYADMLEQVYYFIISFYGWVYWEKQKKEKKERFYFSKPPTIFLYVIITLLLTYIFYVVIVNLHNWFPEVFVEEASYPVLDSFTTVMSLIAMYLITVKKIEGWVYWIIVDLIGIGLYWVKSVKFISIQYVFLLIIAVYGLLNWMYKRKQQSHNII